MWRELNLANAYTLECSFCGPTDGLYKDCHFTPTIMQDMGKQFCLSLLKFTSNDNKLIIKELALELDERHSKEKE
jgi:hypothetical protein